jgi:hypothetical protein
LANNVQLSARKDPSQATPDEFIPNISSVFNDGLSIASFSQSFLSALALQGKRKIDFNSESDMAGVERITDWLTSYIKELRMDEIARKTQLYYDLVAIRNQVQLSETGAPDGFEEMLSEQQTWLAAKLNPSLTRFKIEMDNDLAEHTLSRQPRQIIDIVNFLARMFSKR